MATADVREGPLLGQEVLQDKLWSLLCDTIANQKTQVIALTGRPKYGTSRLARWLSERSQELGVCEAHLADTNRKLDGLRLSLIHI